MMYSELKIKILAYLVILLLSNNLAANDIHYDSLFNKMLKEYHSNKHDLVLNKLDSIIGGLDSDDVVNNIRFKRFQIVTLCKQNKFPDALNKLETLEKEYLNLPDSLSVQLLAARGIYHIDNSEFKKSIPFFDKAAILYEKLNNVEASANSIISKVNALGKLNRRNEAIIELLKLEKIIINDTSLDNYSREDLLLIIYNRLGLLIRRTRDFKRSNEYLAKCLKFKVSKNQIAIVLQNMADNFQYQEECDSAIDYSLKSLAIPNLRQQTKYLNYQTQVRCNTHLKNYTLAKQWLDSLETIVGDPKHPRYDSYLRRKGEVEYNLGNFDEGIATLRKAYNIIQENKPHLKNNILSVSTMIMEAQIGKADDVNLEKDFQVFQSALDSVNANINRGKIEDAVQKYETEKKEQQIILLSKEKELEQAKANRNLLLFLAALLLGGIAAIVFFREKKYNLTLSKKNNEISNLNKEIEHRTANHLKTMMVLIESDIDNSQDSLIKSTLLGQQHRLQVVSSIHAQLQHHGETKNMLLGKYLIDLCNYLEDFYLDKHENLSINLDIKTAKGYEIDALDATNLGLIINELVTNAIKYAFVKQEHPQIDIELKEVNEQLSLSIKDNGIGISSDKIREGAKGINLVQDLVERLQGTIDMKNLDGLLCSITFRPKIATYATR